MKIIDEQLSARRWSKEEFFSVRKEVLGKWGTLRDVDIEEAAAYMARIPVQKNLFRLIRQAHEKGDTLIYPRGGVPLVEDQIELLRHLQDYGGADFLPTTTDSYTRNEQFQNAEIGIANTIESGKPMLNGFPVVNHGVANCRRVTESIEVPAMLLPGTPFVRTIAEIACASGFTGVLGGGISDGMRFTKKLSVADAIRFYQYLDRLVALYQELGIDIHREHTSFLTGTLIPPALAIAIAVLDCLLAAAQGVRQYSIGLGQNLNIVQDVAAMKVAPRISAEYLQKAGHCQVVTPLGSHHWMGAFPVDQAEAFSLICLGTVIGVMGGATHITVKTPLEAVGVPDKEANAKGLRATKKIISIMRGWKMPECPQLEEEVEIITAETRCILDKVLEAGDGDPAVGAVKGFEAGFLDIPWSPNLHVKNKVMPARDGQGAVRYLDCGDLPFPEAIRRYHREKLKSRAGRSGEGVSLEMAIRDVTEMAASVICKK